jgi:molybdate transport system substrate-binding protein
MISSLRILALFALLFQGFGPARANETVTVFAAASLREALTEVAETYATPVSISFGGSGAMARQVQQGAPADLVILANPDWMDVLEKGGLLLPQTRRDLLRNTLVLIGPAGAAPLPDPDADTLLARLDGQRLAMGQHGAVPAGTYGKAWLETIGAWEALLPHLAETADVRAALSFVALGEAPLGIVYGTDAAAEPRVSVLWTVPGKRHPPIVYPVAAVTEKGLPLLEVLSSPEAAAIFARHGFVPEGAEH